MGRGGCPGQEGSDRRQADLPLGNQTNTRQTPSPVFAEEHASNGSGKLFLGEHRQRVRRDQTPTILSAGAAFLAGTLAAPAIEGSASTRTTKEGPA
jgi:hypothetical protein